MIFAVNSLLYLNQSVPPYGVSLNSLTNGTTVFPLRKPACLPTAPWATAAWLPSTPSALGPSLACPRHMEAADPQPCGSGLLCVLGEGSVPAGSSSAGRAQGKRGPWH